MARKFGHQLKVGDTLEVWWKPRRDTITALRPFTGPLADLWPEGAKIVSFAILQGGMTIGGNDVFEVILDCECD